MVNDQLSMADEVQAALSGGNPAADLEENTIETEEGVIADEDIEVATGDELDVQPEEVATGEQPTEGEEKKEEAQPELFSVEVEAEDGKKLVKVDLNDKDKLSKIITTAHEAKKIKSELSSIKAEHELIKPQFEELQTVMNRIEEAATEGVHALVDLLLNEPGAFDRIVQEKLEEKSFYETATPEQIEAFEAKRELEKYKKRENTLSEKAKKEAEKANKAKQEAELAQISASLNNAFLKNSLNGEFNDPDLEDSINEQIWAKAKQSISQMPAEVKVTQKLAEAEFARWKKHYMDIYSRNLVKKTAEAVDKKKEEAQAKVSTTVKQQTSRPSQNDKVNKAVKEGNFVGAFKSLFGG
jgi:DNA-binding protein YbaB